MAGILDMLKGQQPDQNSQGGLLAGGGGQFSERLSDMFAGLAMGADPNQSLARAGMMIAQGNQLRREKSQTAQRANQTAAWLQSQGLGEQEASYLATDPDALRAWYKEFKSGNQPDWQITDLFDDQGRKIKAMVDMKTGKFNQIGGAEAEKPDQTSDIQNFEYARQNGYTGSFADFQASKGIKVDARNMGAIPQGYRIVNDANGNPERMEPIPGGPADTTRTDAARQQSLSASTDVITSAASKARDAYNSATLPVTGTLGRILGNFSETGAAEVRRQVETLKSNAKIDTLQAMRAASPTGGALGAVSDSENAMLAAKAGALDPDSPNFARDLDDYERSLLRTIHGKDAGDRIFDSSRQSSPTAPSPTSSAPSQGGVVDYTDYFK